ncbi:hypothetical protein ACROYT_G013606 [Oculina patagonica]
MANKEDFCDVSSPLDESVNKVSKFSNGKPPSDVLGDCFRCGQRHLSSVCRFRAAQCPKCQRKGHVAKMYSFQKREPPSARYVQDVSQVVNMNENASEVEGVDGEMVDLGLYAINSKGKSGYKVQLSLELQASHHAGRYGFFSVKDHAKPIFLKARLVPYAFKDKVEQELQRLEEVNQSAWAAPVVLVPKKDGSLRVCSDSDFYYFILFTMCDYKTTANQSADVNQYPLPNAEELFATLAGGASLARLIYVMHINMQVELDEESQKYLTINTHKGLYRFKRLPFGVSSAPAIFQRIMDQLLQGVKFTVCLTPVANNFKVLALLKKQSSL